MKLAAFCLALLTTGVSALGAAQPAAQASLRPSALALDSLLSSPGPRWRRGQSDHFVVHVERQARLTPARMLDSLEAAWVHAVALLGAPVAVTPRIHVLVTASRTRFPRLLTPQAKGLATWMPNGGEVIILVANDSVRALTRHEVMHLVAQRAWRPAAPSRTWLSEGLATFADGQCQGTTIMAVGRDLLQVQPALTVDHVMTHFIELWQTDRGRAYVLAGTLAGFLWESRGRAYVQRVWQGEDLMHPPGAFPVSGDALTREWRAHVARAAGAAPGIDPAAFGRAACG